MATCEHSTSKSDFIKVMETFPCLFNIGTMKKPSHTRMKLLITKLEYDIKSEEESYEGERLKELNVLSWLYFQVGDMEEAKCKNDEALYLSTDDLVTLGNRAFLEWYSGSNLSTFLDHLENLKLEKDFPDRKIAAKAYQANLLFRLSGICNMSASITMYDDLVRQQPDNFECKYHLCLAHRRAMTMSNRGIDESKLEEMFKDVADNATETYWKTAAMCELAIFWAKKHAPVRQVEQLVHKAMILDKDAPAVIRKCGMALTDQGNLRGLALLEKSVSLRDNTVSCHMLARAYTNYKMTRNLNRNECDRKAIKNFKASYEFSLKENIRPLLDLGFLYMSRNRFEESMEIYRSLINNWSVTEIYNNPFKLTKISEGLYQLLQKTGGKRKDVFFDRYLSIALITGLELFKRNATASERLQLFDMFVNPNTRMSRNYCFKILFGLIKESVSENHVRQKLRTLYMKGELEERQCVVEESELFLKEGKPGEALLMLDIYALYDVNILKLYQKLHAQAMLEEAKWQLSQGLISCKLLFHRMFNINHSNSSSVEEEDETDSDQTPEADILILQDGHHWKPFLQKNVEVTESGNTNFGIVHQHHMCEDVLQYLFDLEVITNPWLSFTGGNRPDTEEFSYLLKQFSVQLVLLVVDEDTSSEFLQMTDYLLSKTLETKEIDMAIVYLNENTEEKLRDNLSELKDRVRSFKAKENGLLQRQDAKPVTDLVGTEVIDVYFSGKVENAVTFFKFLAPDV